MNKNDEECFIKIEVDSELLKQSEKVCHNSGVTLLSVLSVFIRSSVKNKQTFTDFVTGKRNVELVELLDSEFFYLLEPVCKNYA